MILELTVICRYAGLYFKTCILPYVLSKLILVKAVVLQVERRSLLLPIFSLILLRQLVYGYSFESIITALVEHRHALLMHLRNLFIVMRTINLYFILLGLIYLSVVTDPILGGMQLIRLIRWSDRSADVMSSISFYVLLSLFLVYILVKIERRMTLG